MSWVGTCIVEKHLNPNVLGLEPSATVAINDLSKRLQREGREIFRFGLGQSPFPVPGVVVKSLQEHAGEKDYLPVLGLEELRSAVAEHHRRTFHIDCDADDVLIGPGSKELMFLLQLVYFGQLAIPTPTWVSYAPQARIIGRPIHFLPTHREENWHLTPDRLQQFCDENPGHARLLILTYPSNPTGTTLSAEQLAELAECGRKNRMLLLSDEIYGKIQHRGQHISIVPFYPEGTIFSGGLSKWCGAGGWRLGLFVFPKCLAWLRNAMAAVATETFTSTCAPVQYAAAHAFAGSAEIEDYVDRSRRILGATGDLLWRKLKEAGALVAAPEGGFYLFPDFSPIRERLLARGIQTSAQLCQKLLEETGVATIPGSSFGQDPGEFTLRLAYVDFDGRKALAAAAALDDAQGLDDAFVHEHCGRMLEGVDRLCSWIDDLS